MTNARLAKRLDAIERRLNRLGAQIAAKNPLNEWRAIAGSFANDPLFEKAMRFGKQYRQSLRPKTPKRRARVKGSTSAKDWNANVGIFANDPLFEKAVRYGKQYRQSLRPKAPKRRSRKT